MIFKWLKHNLRAWSQKNFSIWISWRFLASRENGLASSAPLAFAGLVLGVSVLVVSQSVMTGFEVTLKKAMVDVTGDIQIIKRGKLIETWDEFVDDIKSKSPRIKNLSRFAYAEAVASSKGKVNGVLLQGFLYDEIKAVLSLENRIKAGSLPNELHAVAIGKGLAKKFSLAPGDKFYLAVPLATPFESNQFRRRSQEVTVTGVLDLGKNEWNERLILMNLKDLQDLTEIGDRYTGAFLKLDDSKYAPQVAEDLSFALGPRYSITNWYDLNRNLFEAVNLEKIVIFFVVFLIVLVAAFNISSSLNVIIRSRSKDIAILKSMGFSSEKIKKLFLWQGFFVGGLGSVGGFIFGYVLIFSFMWLQNHFSLIAGSVYKLDSIQAHVGLSDFVIIYVSTSLVCMLATWVPARQASRLSVVDGLRSS
jgi:lipoprotein-releasing system permease protein